MMDLLSFNPMGALILSNAALIVGASIALLRFQRMIRKNREFRDSPTGATVQTGADADAVLAGFLERRLAMIHDRLDELSERVDQDIGTPPPAEPLFSHAVRMAQNGASASDLVKTCALNEAEARLMCRLHGRQNVA